MKARDLNFKAKVNDTSVKAKATARDLTFKAKARDCHH